MTEALVTSPPIQSGLSLSRRQRAMLKEMGIHVWQPLPVVPATVAQPQVKPFENINLGAASAHNIRTLGIFDGDKQLLHAAPSAQAAQPIATPDVTHTAASAWRIGKLQTLYADIAASQAARWLVLMESPVSALQSSVNPFDGDAGKLLDNMLRAAKLHTGTALLAPLIRTQSTVSDSDVGATSAASAVLIAELADTFASAKADVVLVMGRLAAQALLQSSEPLAKLRGQIHALHNTPTIITLDIPYLLRNPLEKARAWDDLCLAIHVAKVAG